MAEISLKIVIDPSGALRTFEEMMETMKQRAGVADTGRVTIANLERGLQSLRSELNNTEIGTQRFNELRTAITRTESELRKAGAAASSAGIAFDDVATRIGFRLQGFQNMFSVLSGFFGGFIRESNAGEAATAKLTQALQNRGVYTRELVNDLKAFAAERQQIAAIDDDATVAVMGQLTALGLQGQALRDATVAVQDLATLMDGDMNSAVRLVADAFQGNTMGLKRLKIDIDETALKERGAIVIIEALMKAVGGQAEAFGNTGAGAMKKMQLASDDLRQSFGDLLKDALAPFTSLMRGVIEWTNSGGNAAKSLTLGLAGLGIAFAFVNTSMGAWPYILTATAAALMAIYNAVKDGQGYLVALGGVLGTVALAFTLLQGKAILAAVSMNGVAAGFVTAKVAAMEFFTSIGPVGWILVGLGAIAAAWGAIKNETKNAEEAAKQYREAIRQLSDFKLSIDIGDATVGIADLSVKIDALKKGMKEGKIQASPELLGFELQLQMQRERLELLQDEQTKRAQIADAAKKQAAEEANPKIQLELRELRAKAMQDGIAKELALLDVRHERELQKIDERKEKESLSETQINDLKTAATSAYVADRNRIIQESYEKERQEREKSAADYYDYTQHLKKLDEELAIDLARTDEEKYDLKRSFLEQEIADLEALGPRTLEQEKRLADATIELKKLNNAEVLRLERERQDVEKQLRDLRTGDIAEDSRREIIAVRQKYNTLRQLAMRHHQDVKSINAAEENEISAINQRSLEERKQLWLQEHQGAQVALNAMTAGVNAFVNSALMVHRQAKDELDAVWIAIENSIIGALANMLTAAITNAILSAAIITPMMAGITAAAVPAATLTSIATFGGAAVAGETAVLQALGVVKGASVAAAFEKGGVFEPNQRGFIEGGQYELIAPRQTFEQILRTEIVPMLVKTTKIESMQNQQGGYSDDRIVAELKRVRSRLDKLDQSVYVGNVVGEKDLVKRNIKSAEAYWQRRKR